MDRDADRPLVEHLEEARSELNRVHARASELQAENRSLLRERDELLASSSWRITAPIRNVVTWLRARLVRNPVPAPDRPKIGVQAGIAGLPSALLCVEQDSLEAANASCRRLNLPLLPVELLPAPVSNALDGESVAPDACVYLGELEQPPVIGFIGSRSLQVEISFDARVIVLREGSWESQVTQGALSFLLVETTWGEDGQGWRYALVRDAERRDEFMRLVERCRSSGTPIVVWFRESPENANQFSWLIEVADLTCVADGELLRPLIIEHPGARIVLLPPAVQPRLYNPLLDPEMRPAAVALGSRMVFDGWWDLRPDLPAFEALKELRRHGLLAVESEWEFSQGRLDDRPDFRDVTLGCLSPRDKLLLTRLQGAEIFTDGTLAGSWRTTQRMIRAAASGSMAVSLTSKEPVIPGIALWTPHTHSPAEAVVGEMRDPLALQSRAHLAWRTVMDRHTTAHRMQEVASLLGIAARFLPQPAKVACLLVTMRPDRIRSCIQWFRDDLYANKELIVVVNGPGVDLGAYRRLVSEDDQIRFYQAGRNRSLGACLNYAASLTDAPYWLKIDDDDIYGKQYIADAMRYQTSRPSAVFGKPPMFNYLERQDCLLWDQEWAQLSNVVHAAGRSKFALIAGGTIGGRSDTLKLVKFSESRRGGSDSDFIRRCYQAGLDVLAMDGFSFVRFRSEKEHFHTWNVSEQEIISRGAMLGGRADIARLALI